MIEFRCTRKAPYSNPNCIGHTDLSVRQGYYIVARTAQGAMDKMREMFPNDPDSFTVDEWKTVDAQQCRG